MSPDQALNLKIERIEFLIAESKLDKAFKQVKEVHKVSLKGFDKELKKRITGQIIKNIISLVKIADKSAKETIKLALIDMLLTYDFTDVDSYYLRDLISVLIDNNKFVVAEKICLKQIKRELRQKNIYSSYEGRDYWMLVTEIYYKLKKYKDVKLLLDKVPSWGHKDLKDLISNESDEFAYMIADTFIKLDDHKTAKEIILFCLRGKYISDKLYSTLLSISEPEESLEYLDSIYKINRFEERPLIWKAQVLYELKKYKEAELIAQQAINIDPSDGETGRGDRMRVYSVMANIKEKLGDDETASLFRDVMKAIRLAEEADEFFEMGMGKKAITLYERSLDFFTGAYCIQSRLAIRYASMGELKKAEKHYKKAYELMPSSFGRVESHCFGCEGIFDGQKAQEIAENVFYKMLKNDPKNPQLNYLLGYLREEQGKFSDAITYYRKAVELDPKYINSWKKMYSLIDQTKIDDSELETIIINLLELAPYENSDGRDLSGIKDLKMLWNKIGKIKKIHNYATPSEIYPLKASMKKLESNEENNSYYHYSSGSGNNFALKSTGAIIGDIPLIREILNQLRDD